MENSNNYDQLRLERARKRVKSLAGFYKHLAVYLLVNIVLLAVDAYTLEPGEKFFTFGTFSTAFFWGIGLMFHAFGVFGTTAFLGNDWEERKIRQIMNESKTTKWE